MPGGPFGTPPRAMWPLFRSLSRAELAAMNEPGTIGVLLVDDHGLVLEALANALGRESDLTVVGSAGSVRDVAEADHARPDVAIVDYHLPDGTGADACRQIKARWPGTHIVVLSATATDDEVMDAVRAGADGYLTKNQRLSVVVGAIRATAAGQPLVSPALLGHIARGLAEPSGKPVLTEPLSSRELTVLRELAAGHSTRAIALELGISIGTVRRHVEAIRRKFHVGSKLEAVSEALRHHIVELTTA